MKDEFFFFFRNFLGKMEGDVYLGLYVPVFWLFEFFSSFPLPLSPLSLSLFVSIYTSSLISPLPYLSPLPHSMFTLPYLSLFTLLHQLFPIPYHVYPSLSPQISLPSPSTPPRPPLHVFLHPTSLPTLTLHPYLPSPFTPPFPSFSLFPLTPSMHISSRGFP